jgi:hypothetical protein
VPRRSSSRCAGGSSRRFVDSFGWRQSSRSRTFARNCASYSCGTTTCSGGSRPGRSWRPAWPNAYGKSGSSPLATSSFWMPTEKARRSRSEQGPPGRSRSNARKCGRRLRGVNSLDWPCGPERRPKARRPPTRFSTREAKSRGEQSSTCRASTSTLDRWRPRSPSSERPRAAARDARRPSGTEAATRSRAGGASRAQLSRRTRSADARLPLAS